MTSYLFEELLQKAIDSDIVTSNEEQSRLWFRQRARIVSTTPEKLQQTYAGTTRFTQRPVNGRMYMFFYDPKHAKRLPYYDRFPLVIPIKSHITDSRYMIGLNLHYLQPILRAKLMDALYEFASDDNFNDYTKIQVTTDMLKHIAKLRYFKPCIKKYLRKNIKSRFLKIYSYEWDIGLFLPTERFINATKQKVWGQSRIILKENV